MDIDESGKIELDKGESAVVFRENGTLEFAVGRKLGHQRLDPEHPALFFGSAVAGYAATHGEEIIKWMLEHLAETKKDDGGFSWFKNDSMK